jgi:hypothetical protein
MLSDENIILFIDDCNNFLSYQDELSNSIMKAFFQLALARKTGQTRTDPCNLRLDIEPVSTLNISSSNLFSNDTFSFKNADQPSDPTILFTALPNPNLKASKLAFEKSLEIILKLANLKIKLIKLMDSDKIVI